MIDSGMGMQMGKGISLPGKDGVGGCGWEYSGTSLRWAQRC